MATLDALSRSEHRLDHFGDEFERRLVVSGSYPPMRCYTVMAEQGLRT